MVQLPTQIIRIRIRDIYWPIGICLADDSYHVLVASVQHPIIMLAQATVAHIQLQNIQMEQLNKI